jgi:hypothetical protein
VLDRHRVCLTKAGRKLMKQIADAESIPGREASRPQCGPG